MRVPSHSVAIRSAFERGGTRLAATDPRGVCMGRCSKAAVLFFLGCVGGESGEVRAFTDGLGRACTIDLLDVRTEAFCDVDAADVTTCVEGVPCFTVQAAVRFDERNDPAANCGGCCVEEDRTTFVDSATCAPLQCETTADCLYLNEACIGGACYREVE